VAWAITADRAELKFRHIAEDFLKMQDALREKTRENINLRYELNDKIEEVENLHGAIDDHTGFGEDENSPGETADESVSTPAIEQPHIEAEPTDAELDSQRADLQRMISEYVPNVVDERVLIEENGGPVVASTKYDPPFVISQPDYAWGDEGIEYQKTTLRYFPAQQTLLDEDEEPIDDVERYVGWRSLNRFGEESGNDDVVYVRNRRLETDFEVERVTDEELPLHVQYALPKIEFLSHKAAGKLKLSEEDME
jgi:hypothetical protein